MNKNASKGDFTVSKFDVYNQEVQARWGNTAAYGEYAEKTEGKSKAELFAGMDVILSAFSACKADNTPDSLAAQDLVKSLQDYITTHFYTCTKEILAGLGQMYTADDRFKSNIDMHGEGTAEFISTAISIYCAQ